MYKNNCLQQFSRPVEQLFWVLPVFKENCWLGWMGLFVGLKKNLLRGKWVNVSETCFRDYLTQSQNELQQWQVLQNNKIHSAAAAAAVSKLHLFPQCNLSTVKMQND